MSAEDRLTRVENALSTLVELAQKADERMTRLEESQRRTDESQRRTDEGIRSLLAIAEIHDREIAMTNERLNALINTVERFVSKSEDGKS
jgi:hypothetical protein